ncbi:MAG: hypothetical protein HKL88_05505 [Bacteroidia bacterium]|nr:hypothetical protein [Bacteroidia bacterium]
METTESKTQSKNASSFKIGRNWSTQSKNLRKSYSQLSESDLKLEPGKEEELLSRMETKLDKNREEVISIIQNSEEQSVL